MTISIFSDPEPSNPELYREQYERAMLYRTGPKPTIEEWLRAVRATDRLGGQLRRDGNKCGD